MAINEPKIYNADNLPTDAEIWTGADKEFDPIDPTEMYTVEVTKAQLIDNKFYKPDEEDPTKKGSKYQFSFEYVIIDKGEFYGRRLWDYSGLAFKPNGKRGATKLYKIIMAAIKKDINLEECQDFAPDLQTFVTNLEELVVGQQIKVGIENTTNPDTGKIRTKISTYNKTKKTLPKYNPETKAEKQDFIEGLEKERVDDEKIDPDEVPF
jgi:hypothetical protein